MAASSTDFKAVILAGGSGERFWPLSTAKRPKQFLTVFGRESLLVQAYRRLAGFVAPKDVYVVTSRDLVAATRRELVELPKENIIGEPMRRDTAAAVALGLRFAGETGVVGFFPADQLVLKPTAFRAALRKAVTVARRSAAIVTLGITPTRAATGFGYVDPKTGRFFEKPTAEKAEAYLREGFLWNAGMFIAKASTFRAAIATHAPALTPLFSARSFARVYPALPRLSFDYAVMEKFKDVRVVPAACGWDDVGGYAAFDKHFPHDKDANVREGPCFVHDAHGNICVARSAKVALLGVRNLVVVATKDGVLVADKSRLGEMKQLLAAARG